MSFSEQFAETFNPATLDYSKAGYENLVLAPFKGLGWRKYVDARDNDWFPEMGVAGPYATGKSTMVMDWLIRRGIDYPGSNMLIARATLTSLKGSTLVKIAQRVGAIFDSENKNEAMYRFPVAKHPVTGMDVQTTLKGLGLDRSDLEQVFKSTEYHSAFIEEGDEVDGDSHDLLLARLRQVCYHRELTVWHLAMMRANQWGIGPEDAYEIMLDDPRHPVGQHQLPKDHPMPGPTVLKTVWNPPGAHMWDRYVGIPHPEGSPSPQWIKDHVGVRDKITPPEDLKADGFTFRAGTYLLTKDGERRYAKKEVGPKDNRVLELIGGGEIPKNEASLIMQRACIYIFKDENESRDYQNEENSYLMENVGQRRRAFLGAADSKQGRVFSNYIDDYWENGGNLIRWPGGSKEEGLARLAETPYIGFGGIDQGGRHATGIVAGLITAQTGIALLYSEYVRSGVSARQSAQDALGMVLPNRSQHWWAHDPSMTKRTFATDNEYSLLDEYRAILRSIMPADPGDKAFDYVNDQLIARAELIGQEKKPKLLIFDNMHQIREVMLKLTWKMVNSQRDRWEVDLGDAIKYAMSAYRKMRMSAMGATGEPVIQAPGLYAPVGSDETFGDQYDRMGDAYL